jgi:monoamine oxidase
MLQLPPIIHTQHTGVAETKMDKECPIREFLLCCCRLILLFFLVCEVIGSEWLVLRCPLFVWALLLLIALKKDRYWEEMEEHHHQQHEEGGKVKVIVVGAGASGLGAARWLVDNDIHNRLEVVVLEARDRIGGRVHTAKDHAGEANKDALGLFDLGASWIHDHSEKNPISMMAKTLSSHIVYTDFKNSLAVDGTGKKIPDAVLLRHWNNFVDTIEDVAGTARKQPAITTHDKSLERLMMERFGEQWNQPLCQGIAAEYDFIFGTSLYNCSATECIDADWLKHEEELDFLLPSKGYGSILDSLVSGEATMNPKMSRPPEEAAALDRAASKPLLVLTSNDVTSIVQTQSGDYMVTADNKITSIPAQMNADAVIVTVPLGVLKSKSIAFSPELSARKQQAIDRIGFGNVVKVIMEFPKIFWATHAQFLHIFDEANCNSTEHGRQRRGCLNYFLNGYVVAKKKILVGYGLGDGADYIENVRTVKLCVVIPS